jgi:oligopeptide/dipeptide ABC transporter ATP-binding protein
VDASLRATILGSLRKLNEELRISIIYITHDLATAYQIGDNIVVLYRASVAEVGDVERVVKAPQHPYTQLLISSIPRVSTERGWIADDARLRRPADVVAPTGCKFAPRCPVADAACTTARPALFRTEPHRAVACYQYQTAPVLPPEEMGSVFAAGGAR